VDPPRKSIHSDWWGDSSADDDGLPGERRMFYGIWQPSGNERCLPKTTYSENLRKTLIYIVFLVGPEGFEPSTNGLRVRCSTN
jgi:hypothetical protein